MVPVFTKVAATLALFSALCPAQTRRALVIGINTYEPPPGETAVTITADPEHSALFPKRPFRTSASFRNLGGAVADARSIRQILIDRFSFHAENIRLVEDREATRSAILEGIRKQLMPPEARRGDMSVLFYAGHGSQVFNSKSSESDHLDESLVPADSYKGARDIRDKELGRVFNDIVDRGIVLTVIIDSCHSGSIARGKRTSVSRAMEFDPRDAQDPGDVVRASAQERGALVISSTQESDEAKETADGQHGVFTWALAKVLESSLPDQRIDTLFQQVRSLMQSEASWQEPVLAGARDRLKRTLLGEKAVNGAAESMLVKGKLQGNHLLLEGALAASLSPGCELANQGVRLRITKVLNLTKAEAEVIAGSVTDAERDSVFELSRWVVPVAEALRILVGAGLEPVLREDTGVIKVVHDRSENPHYILESRSAGGRIEYRLAAANATQEQTDESPLPVQTDWVPAASAPQTLTEYALRIQRIRGWLRLVAPPSSHFPYQLGLKNTNTGQIALDGTLVEGENYRLVLKSDDLAPEAHVAPRYIYAFSVDRQGKGTLLYPTPSTGNEGNRLPPDPAPALIELGQKDELIQVAPPFGTDTYILLTTVQPLPHPGVLDFEGVETAGANRGHSDPLENLLAGMGTRNARGPVPAPAKWSVSKTQFRSVPKQSRSAP